MTLPEPASGVQREDGGNPPGKAFSHRLQREVGKCHHEILDEKYNYLPDLVVIEGPLAGGHLGFDRKQLEDIEGMHYEEEVMRILEAVKPLEGPETGKSR